MGERDGEGDGDGLSGCAMNARRVTRRTAAAARRRRLEYEVATIRPASAASPVG